MPFVLIASGALGFHLGAGAFADWQVAVETAQVLAGLVEYPPGNPFYVYHTKLWTVLHQWLAVLLAAGLDERTLSVVLSGILGMVSFQALSLIVYALSGDALLAAGAAPLIFFSRAAEAGAVYPIWLVGTTHTYGVIALSYAALVVGFLGCGWLRTGLFLLGAAPAIHPSVGIWLILIAGLVFVSDARRQAREMRHAWPALAAGAAVTLASLAIQLIFVRDVPPAGPETTSTYLAAFVAFWDSHRQPVPLDGATVKVNAAALVVGLLWLARDRSRPDDAGGRAHAHLTFRFVAAAAALGLVLALVSWIPPDRMPAALLIAMPGRLLNLNMIMFTAALVGLAAAGRRRWTGAAVLLLLCAALLFGNRSRLWMLAGDDPAFARIPPAARPNATNVVLIGALLALAVARLGRDGSRPRAAQACYAGALLVAGWSAVLTWSLERPPNFDMDDRTDDALFRTLAEGEGMLLTGGDLHLIQLRTRRPVLLDGGGLDALPYAVEAAPAMERILRDVYGIELLNPPEEARYRGTVPAEYSKAVWQSYTPAQWAEIAERYGVRQVVTPGGWELALPVAVRNRALTVYDMARPR